MKKFMLLALGIVCCLATDLRAQEKAWDTRLLQASDAAYAGHYQQARQLAQAYSQEHPEDPNGYFLTAMSYDWERNLTSQPAQALMAKAVDFYKQGSQLAFLSWDKDQENVDRLIDAGNGFIFLGRALSNAGSNLRGVLTAKKGPKYLEAALQKSPQRWDGMVTLGLFDYVADATPGYLSALKAFFGIKGNKAQGLAELEKSAAQKHLFQNDALVTLYYLNIEYEKNYAKALEYLERLESKFPENPRWQLAKAEVISNQDKARGVEAYLQAVQWCEKRQGLCDKKFPFQALFNAGRLSKELGQVDKARDYLTRAMAFAPATDPERSSEDLLLQGEIEAASGNKDQALEKFHQATQGQGLPKEQKKKVDEAIEQLCRADPRPSGC